MTLKVKFADFELISRSRTVASLVGSREELEFMHIGSVKGHLPDEKSGQTARRVDLRICRRTRRVPGSD